MDNDAPETKFKRNAKLKAFRYILLILLTFVATVSCIEDGMSNTPSDQPEFSVDTLDMGISFAGESTATYKFMVYNRHSKIMNLSHVSLRGDDGKIFRINVDGTTGSEFENIQIRPNDSIYVMVAATVPPPVGTDSAVVVGTVDFIVHGQQSSVALRATGRNVEVIKGQVIDKDTRWSASIPYQIFDSLVVAPGVTLTLDPGVQLMFHAKGRLEVRGTLVSEGTVDKPVVMTGDRLDDVISGIPFDLMSAQWDGVTFHPTSKANRLEYTVIKNMSTGIFVDSVQATSDGIPGLTVINSRLRNSAGYCLGSYFSDIAAYGVELSDAALTPLLLIGGNIDMAQVTVTNYYLFSAIAYPLVNLSHFNEQSAQTGVSLPYMKAKFVNCIFYGLGDDINVGNLDGTDVYIKRTLFKSVGTDDDHFIECVWGEDPLYYTIRDEYIFDYRLRPDSPAIGCGDPSAVPEVTAVDFYGVRRASSPALGAFEFVPPAE